MLDIWYLDSFHTEWWCVEKWKSIQKKFTEFICCSSHERAGFTTADTKSTLAPAEMNSHHSHSKLSPIPPMLGELPRRRSVTDLVHKRQNSNRYLTLKSKEECVPKTIFSFFVVSCLAFDGDKSHNFHRGTLKHLWFKISHKMLQFWQITLHRGKKVFPVASAHWEQ